MEKKVTVNLDIDSPYIENDSKFHDFKRRMTYRLPLKLIRKYFKKNRSTCGHIDILDIGVGSGYFAKFFLLPYFLVRVLMLRHGTMLWQNGPGGGKT